MAAEPTSPWAQLAKELLDLTHRFDDVLEADEAVRVAIRQAALMAYAQHQVTDPSSRARIDEALADLEARLRDGRPYEVTVTAEELAARIQAMREEEAQHRAAG
jgi:hypothetical protein